MNIISFDLCNRIQEGTHQEDAIFLGLESRL